MSEPTRIEMRVDAGRRLEPYHPLWNWFGHDEPNYTYTEHGRKLLGHLAGLTSTPPYVRTHNLLTSGDGEASLKWGSTNAYTEDASGNPVYDWRIMDRIFDAYAEAGVRPLVQIGFTPEALSGDTGPYRHDWSLEANYSTITTGWAAPPKDLGKWTDLIKAWATHALERYGRETVADWLWEVWNEPDGAYWTGTTAEFCEMFDATVRAVKSVLPEARVGGPHTCGAFANDRAATFLRAVLAHVVEHETPIDFIAFHAKGNPAVHEGHVRMGLRKQLRDIETNLAIMAEFPQLAHLPVIIGESDPEGCAACSARVHPQNAYRNGPLYGAYAVESMLRTYELSRRAGIHIEGAVTWAFMFDEQPWFDGFRDLATNGVDKAVLNAFRMLGKLGGDWIATESSGQRPLDDILASGVRGAPDVGCVATRDEAGVSVLMWNYHDDDRDLDQTAHIALAVAGLPDGALSCREFRMDATHSNSFGTWQAMGAPQDPTPDQIAELEAAAGLACLSDRDAVVSAGAVQFNCDLPRQGVSLFRLET